MLKKAATDVVTTSAFILSLGRFDLTDNLDLGIKPQYKLRRSGDWNLHFFAFEITVMDQSLYLCDPSHMEVNGLCQHQSNFPLKCKGLYMRVGTHCHWRLILWASSGDSLLARLPAVWLVVSKKSSAPVKHFNLKGTSYSIKTQIQAAV